MAVFDVVKDRLGKAELRDPVAENSADLVFSFKNSDVVAVSCQDDGDGDASGARADDSGFDAIGRVGAFGHFVGVGGGDVVFNGGKVDGSSLFPENAVALALFFVIAYETADRGERVVFKKFLSRFCEQRGRG